MGKRFQAKVNLSNILQYGKAGVMYREGSKEEPQDGTGVYST